MGLDMRSNIQKLLDDFPDMFEFCSLEVPLGWEDLVYELTSKIYKIEPVQVSQIKEKFGGLRYYTNGHSDIVDDLINEYEAKSFKVCDVCGEEGILREHGYWLSTRCEEHNK
jgi:hypothetical protein